MNDNVKVGRAAARSGEWAQNFSYASCYSSCCIAVLLILYMCVEMHHNLWAVGLAVTT